MQNRRTIILFFLSCIAIGVIVGVVAAKATTPKLPVPMPVATVQTSTSSTIQPVAVQITSTTTTSSTTSATTSATTSVPSPAAKPKPKPAFSCPKPDPSQDTGDLWLEPVGPDDSIGNYVPAGLVVLDKYVPTTATTICLTETAATALKAMFAAMNSQKIYPLVASGFRDMDYQEHLHTNNNVVTNGYSSVAEPGHSEHQLGMTVDLIGIPDSTNTNYSALNGFGNTPDYAWLTQNAASYGFVQSYQSGEESVTGYIPEPWHWRYVGIDNAKAIVASGKAPVLYLEDIKSAAKKQPS